MKDMAVKAILHLRLWVLETDHKSSCPSSPISLGFRNLIVDMAGRETNREIRESVCVNTRTKQHESLFTYVYFVKMSLGLFAKERQDDDKS